MRLRLTGPVLLLASGLVLAGCGGSSSSGLNSITVGAARTYKIVDFQPSGAIAPGKPTQVSFEIQQPDGTILKEFKTGPGPHTGVHLIFVRKDLSTIIHHHPPLNGTGKIVDSVTFPASGPYRLVVDVYPLHAPANSVAAAPTIAGVTLTPNFQLFRNVRVAGAYRPLPLPPASSTASDDGYRFTLTGASDLKAIEPRIVKMTVTDPNGKPASFEPWYGALAHAIFFREGSLDYFHTHVCSNAAIGCTSVFGASKVVGTSSKPGELNVGVLLPLPGTWRLFLQCQVDGQVLTAPFTLHVA
jgi:hypothetical protein